MAVVVVGAGHNGLIAALKLAKAGRKVVLCEASEAVGGLARMGLLPTTAHMAPEVLNDLGVSVHWTDRAQPHLVRPDGTVLSVEKDEGTQHWWAFCDRYRAMARQLLLAPAPRLRTDAPLWPMAKAAMGLRRLGKDEMMTVLRVAPSSAEDALAEHIDDPQVRAVLAGTGLLGTWMGPLSPTGATVMLLDAVLAGKEIQGGGPALVEALEHAVRSAGVDVRCSTRVTRIARDSVTLANGETLQAEAVVACCDPRTALLDLIDPHDLPVRVEYQAQEHRVRGIVAVLQLEISARPDLPELVHTAVHPHDVERAFDGGKNRKLPEAPPVLVRFEENRATVWMTGVSQGCRSEGDLDSAILHKALTALERVWPGVRDAVKGHTLWTPDRLESELGLAGGHLWHGELALDQVWSLRPGLDLSAHRTPVPGLFLGSSGAHPTGGLTGIPGWLAAKAVLG